MVILRTVLLITIVIGGCFSGRSQRDNSEEDVSPNCDDGLAALGLAQPCTPIPITTSPAMTPVQQPDWCRFNNGTSIALGYTFIYRNCTICECTRLKVIRCLPLQCLPTYCVDETLPSRREGQCCAQCKSDTSSDACLYNDITYPHGTVLKSIDGKMQCWCQWGHIECRPFISSGMAGIDLLSDGVTISIIAMILIIVIFFGLLVCCSGSLIIYYYYQRHQATFQQAYDQYMNSMGWQPMEDGEYEGEKGAEEYPAEMYSAAEEKQAEAEQIPPPYAIFEEPSASKKE